MEGQCRPALTENGTAPIARLFWEKVPLILLAGASSVATWYAQRYGMQHLAQLPMTARVGNGLVAYAIYLRKMLWPADLAAFYPHPGTSLSGWSVATAALLLTALTALVVRLWRRAPYLAVGWFWYLGTLVPVIGLVQVGLQALADRYTYVPLIGIFLMFAWGGADLLAWRHNRDRGLVAVAAGILLFVCGLLTWLQVHHWRNDVTLWARALAVEPRNAFAHTDMACSILEESSAPQDEQLAFEHFTQALAIEPNQVAANLGLGMLLQKRGRIEEAIHRFRKVLELEPGKMAAHHALGSALAMEKKLDEAVVHLREAVRLDAGDAENHYLLGEVLRLQGQREEALGCFRRAVELKPDSVAYRCNLALALHEQGQVEAARAQYQEASRIDPRWTDGANATARRLATQPDSKGRDGGLALTLATQACQATDEQQPLFLDTLAAAYAEVGRYDEAVATARKALALARAENHSGLAQGVQERLRRYEKHQPLRESP